MRTLRGTELHAAAMAKLLLLIKERDTLLESAITAGEKELRVAENAFKNKKMELDLEKKLLQVAEKDLKGLAQLKDRLSQEEEEEQPLSLLHNEEEEFSAFEEAALLQKVADDVKGKEEERIKLRKMQ